MHEIPEVNLSSAALLSAAETETGLADWGSCGYFREPLQRYLESVEETGNFHQLGRLLLWRTALRLLSNRLKVQRDYREHPDILSTPIAKPLFILGLPRTGTTLLHNLMALDPNARSIRLWQGLFPSPPPSSTKEENDPRIAMTVEHVAMINQLAPRLAIAHALEPTGPEECLWLLEHTFADLIFDLRGNVPRYSEWLHQHYNDIEPYADYRRMVQLLAWGAPGSHWVFKAPRHLLSLAALLKVFPEARLVQTHRSPSEVIPSICSLCEISRGMSTEAPDKLAIGDFGLNRLADGIDRAMATREEDVPQRYVDVDYRELVADPVAAVRRIYDVHGYDFSKAFAAAMQDWLGRNRQHKHGKHTYALEDYRLTVTQVDQRFANYRKRFSV